MTLLETFDAYILPQSGRVRQLVRRWCREGDREEAYQVCMVHLWEKLPQFVPQSRGVEGASVEQEAERWVARLVRRRLIDLHREQSRRDYWERDAVLADGTCVLDDWADDDEWERRGEVQRQRLLREGLMVDAQLVEGLLSLPPEQRRALELRADGCSLNEVAQQLRCSLSRATKLCFHARQKMKRRLLQRI